MKRLWDDLEPYLVLIAAITVNYVVFRASLSPSGLEGITKSILLPYFVGAFLLIPVKRQLDRIEQRLNAKSPDQIKLTKDDRAIK